MPPNVKAPLAQSSLKEMWDGKRKHKEVKVEQESDAMDTEPEGILHFYYSFMEFLTCGNLRLESKEGRLNS